MRDRLDEVGEIVFRMESAADGSWGEVSIIGDWPERVAVSQELVAKADYHILWLSEDDSVLHFTAKNGSARYAVDEIDSDRGLFIASRIHEQEPAHA